jgi:hypothetical protein
MAEVQIVNRLLGEGFGLSVQMDHALQFTVSNSVG